MGGPDVTRERKLVKDGNLDLKPGGQGPSKSGAHWKASPRNSGVSLYFAAAAWIPGESDTLGLTVSVFVLEATQCGFPPRVSRHGRSMRLI